MTLRNTPDTFGWLSRVLHWTMALAIIAMIVLGQVIEEMEPSLSNLWLIGLHKSTGIALLAAAVVRVLWHRVSPPPPPIADGATPLQLRLAHWVHVALYILIFAMPLSGWVASAASGPDVVTFGITLPRIAPTSETLEEAAFGLHELMSKLLIVCLAAHIAGALYRAILKQDGTLRRMTRG